MPYSKTSELPASVQKLSDKAQRQWMHVWNGCNSNGGDESKCFATANGVVKKKATGEEWPEDLTSNGVEESEIVAAEKSYQYLDSWDYEASRFSQDDANYNPVGMSADKACANCRFFVSPARCTMVSGDISPTGVSDFWAPTPVFTPQPIEVVIVGSSKAAEESSVSGGFWNRVRTLFNGAVAHGGVQGGAKSDDSGTVIQFYKMKDGQYRWFARVTNKWVDRQKEILTEAAHKEYVEWADETQAYPELWLWHAKGTKWGDTDWLEYSDGFLHASGLVDKGKEFVADAIVAQAKAGKPAGISHGFIGRQKGDIVSQYRTYEISVLPLESASVWTTDFNLLQKEKEMAFNQKKKDWLAGIGFPSETVQSFEKETEQLAEQLKSLGLSYKEFDQSAEGATAGAGEAVKAGEKSATDLLDGFMAMHKEYADNTAQALTALINSQKELREAIVELKKSDDDKVATTIASKVAQTAGFSAATSDTTVMGKKEDKPQDWLFGHITEVFQQPAPAATAKIS